MDTPLPQTPPPATPQPAPAQPTPAQPTPAPAVYSVPAPTPAPIEMLASTYPAQSGSKIVIAVGTLFAIGVVVGVGYFVFPEPFYNYVGKYLGLPAPAEVQQSATPPTASTETTTPPATIPAPETTPPPTTPESTAPATTTITTPEAPIDSTKSSKYGFRLNTTPVDSSVNVVGSTDIKIIGRLGAPNGKRSLVLVNKGEEKTIADIAWILPPTGAVNASGQLLVCWNELTGPEDPQDSMPDPAKGVALLCRYGNPASLGTAVTVDPSSYLRKIIVGDDGKIVLTYIRSQSGLLFGGTPQPGDGVYSRVYNGTELEAPTAVGTTTTTTDTTPRKVPRVQQ